MAAEAGLRYQFVKYETFPDLLDAVQAGTVDVAVSGITITAEREEYMDFSHGYMRSDLKAVVPSSMVYVSVFQVIFSPGRTKALISLLIFVVFAAHIIWWADQGCPSIDDRYLPGIFEAMYFTVVTMATVGYGDIAPKRWATRLFSCLVMIVGISFFCQVVSDLVAYKAVSACKVRKPSDLCGMKVATIDKSSSVGALRRLGATVVPVRRLDDGWKEVTEGRADAMVYDGPNLQNWILDQPEARLLPFSFEQQDYGFAMTHSNATTEKVNRAILRLKENGVYDRLYASWFGAQ